MTIGEGLLEQSPLSQMGKRFETRWENTVFTYLYIKYTANKNNFKNFLCLSLRSKILLRAGHAGAKKDNGYTQK